MISLNCISDFTASHTEDVMNLPTELDKDTVKLYEQVNVSLPVSSLSLYDTPKIQSLHKLWQTTLNECFA